MLIEQEINIIGILLNKKCVLMISSEDYYHYLDDNVETNFMSKVWVSSNVKQNYIKIFLSEEDFDKDIFIYCKIIESLKYLNMKVFL